MARQRLIAPMLQDRCQAVGFIHGGNLAHALKTPLAVLVSLAEREELRANPELRATLREQLEQIEQRTMPSPRP